jgi:hypothetical protein
MDRLILAIWILLAGFGFYGITTHAGSGTHSVTAMDGGLIPPMK